MGEYVVTLDEKVDASIIAKRLLDAGFKVIKILGDLGILIIEADQDQVSKLETSDPDVIAIERSTDVGI